MGADGLLPSTYLSVKADWSFGLAYINGFNLVSCHGVADVPAPWRPFAPPLHMLMLSTHVDPSDVGACPHEPSELG